MKGKDVVLIYAPVSPGNRPRYGLPPLGVLYLSTFLKSQGFNVSVVDAEINGLTVSQAADEALKFNPSIVGISAMTSVFVTALKIAKEVKKRNPDVKVCMGGPHINSTKEEALGISDSIDYLAYGESERTIVELARSIKQGYPSLSQIDGLIFRDNGQIITNKPRRFIQNLNELPFPELGLIDDFEIKSYDHPMAERRPITSIMASRGCPYQCLFCDVRTTFGGALRLRDPRNVVDEIEHYQKDYGVRYLIVKDSTFNINKKWAFEFCRQIELRNLDILWRCYIRADLVEEDLFRRMKSAGCRGVFIGAESGSQRILDILNKQVRLEDTERAVAILKKLKIESIANFILGNPEETKETVEQTIEFAKKLDATYTHFVKATAYPGNGFYRWGIQTKRLKDPRWYLKDSIEYKESFLYDPNVGGTFEFTEFDLDQVVKRAHWQLYFSWRFTLRMLLRAIRRPAYLVMVFRVAPKMIRWARGKWASTGERQRQTETSSSSFSERRQVWSRYWSLRSHHRVANFLMNLRMNFGSRGFVKTALKYSNCDVVLEAGCGSSISSIMLARKKKGCRIIGIDFMEEALLQTKLKSHKYRVPISLVEADIVSIPIKTKAVSLAWNIGTLEHFDDALPVIKEMRRVSEISIGFVPADSYIWKIYKFFCRLLGYPQQEQEKCKLYSKQQLRRDFERAGFSKVIIEKAYDIFFPFYAGIGIR